MTKLLTVLAATLFLSACASTFDQYSETGYVAPRASMSVPDPTPGAGAVGGAGVGTFVRR